MRFPLGPSCGLAIFLSATIVARITLLRRNLNERSHKSDFERRSDRAHLSMLFDPPH
jgi:hypothetical protein